MTRLTVARAAVAAALTFCTATTIVLLGAPDASAAPAPAVSPSTVQRGGSFTVTGTGCVDPAYNGSTGRSAWYAQVQTTPLDSSWTHTLGSVETNERDGGAWSITLRLPERAGPGDYAVYAHCSTGGPGFDYPTAPFTVVGDPLPPTPSVFPNSRPTRVLPPTRAVPPPAGPPAAPRTTAPPSTTASTTAPAPTSTPPTPETSPAVAVTTPVAAPGCTDCRKLGRDEPVPAGDRLTLSYEGYQPGEQVTLVMRSTPVELGTFTADAAGVVTATFRLPASTDAGAHTLTFSGALSGDHVVRFRLAAARQEAEPAAAPASEGTDLTLPLALGGAAAVLLVAGGFVLHRRRATRLAEPSRPESLGQPTETPSAEPIA